MPVLRTLFAALITGLCGAEAQAFQASHYALSLRPDFSTQTLHGQARIRLDADGAPSNAIAIAAPNLRLSAARIAGQALTLRRSEAGWLIPLSEAQARAQSLDLEIDYEAPAADGLVFASDHVYTAYHACHWLPCASAKLARVSIDIALLDLPAGMRSLASGVEVAPQRWSQAAPYPLYTLGFAAGRFNEAIEQAGHEQLRYLGTEDDAASLQARFKDTPRMLAFFEAKAGLPLPQGTYTQLLVPGGVAQEVSSYAVIGKRLLDPILQDPQEDWVIAHEMAHQWWGNLITCADWRDFWLNEGITTFMTAAWKQARWGEAAYQHELQLATQRWQVAKDAGFDKALSWPGEYPSLRLKRSIHYSKGALFMHELRKDLGEAAFWDGLRRYTRANAGRAVRAADLQSAMEEAAGRSLQALFKAWVG